MRRPPGAGFSRAPPPRCRFVSSRTSSARRFGAVLGLGTVVGTAPVSGPLPSTVACLGGVCPMVGPGWCFFGGDCCLIGAGKISLMLDMFWPCDHKFLGALAPEFRRLADFIEVLLFFHSPFCANGI